MNNQYHQLPFFNFDNYPKSYGSIGLSDYRLQPFLKLSNHKLNSIEKRLWKFIDDLSKTKKPINIYKKLVYLDSGWEWSVFTNSKFVLKIPSGIYTEINDLKYLENTKHSYKIIQKYIPPKYIAKTRFNRQNNQNIITQEYIQGKSNFKVGYHTQNKLLLHHLQSLLKSMLILLEERRWLPDFDIRRGPGGFVIKNIIIDKLNCPKIIDFTSYYDVYRLYPYRQKLEIKNKRRQIKDFLSWINQKNV